ncbi:hypothetical protein, partial [Paraburkholderia caffeinilytica]|uniref:hypothetical protein n=1 Tax=Paraburkholderia caffeinilytica TaxID=1761016 RepID=UPI001C2EC5E1
TKTAPGRILHLPAPLRSASLHQQQRNEIMENDRQVVNPLRAIIFKKLRGTETVLLHGIKKMLRHPS